MYNVCGTKWSKIHTGPLWNVDTVAQVQVDGTNSIRDPIKVFNECDSIAHTYILYPSGKGKRTSSFCKNYSTENSFKPFPNRCLHTSKIVEFYNDILFSIL